MALIEAGKCGGDKTPATLEYDKAAHTLLFKDGQGGATFMLLNTGKIECDADGKGFVYTDERGQQTHCRFDDDSGITELAYDRSTGVLSWKDKDGDPRSAQLANTDVSYDSTSHTITAKSPEHGTQTLPLNVGSIELIGNTVRYRDEKGMVTNLDLPEVKCEYDKDQNLLKLTNENGLVHTCALNNAALKYDSATHDLTFTDNKGVEFPIDLNVGSIRYVQGTHTITYTDEEGKGTALQLGKVQASFDPVTNRITITDEAGEPMILQLTSTDVSYDPATHDLTVSRPGLPDKVLDLNTGKLDYDQNAHRLIYTDEEGQIANFDLGVGSLAWDNGLRKLTYTRENGTVQSFIIPDAEGDRVQYDAAAGIMTVVHPDGAVTNIAMGGSGAMSYDNTNHILTFTGDNGVSSNMPLNVGSLTYNAGDHSLTYTDERGTESKLTLDVPTLTFDSATNKLTFTDERGSATTITLPVGDKTSYDAVGKTITVTHGDGTTTTIPNPDSKLVYDPTNDTVTHTSGDGSVVTFPVDQLDVDYDAAAGVLKFTDRQGTTTTVPVCCPTLTYDSATDTVTWTNGQTTVTYPVGDKVTDNGDGTYTVTKVDGSTFTISTAAKTDVESNADGSTTIIDPDGDAVTIKNPAANIETVTGCLVDNTDPTNPVVEGVKSIDLDTGQDTQDLLELVDLGGCRYRLRVKAKAPAPTASAVGDDVGAVTVGTAKNVDVSVNDTPCDQGATTTYQLVAGSEINCTVSGTLPNAVVVPTGPGAFLFRYEILCNGTVVDEAVVYGISSDITADAVDDNLGTLQPGSALSGSVAANDTTCSSGVTTYQLVAGSAVNCSPTLDTAGTIGGVVGTTAGAFSFQYDILCDGVKKDTATVSGTVSAVTADAVDDSVGNVPVGTDKAIDVSQNDVSCSSGTTTYELVAGSPTNCVVVGVGPNYSVSPSAAGPFSFKYNILCDGVVIDTATVSGTGTVTVTADAVDDTITDEVVLGTSAVVDVAANDTICTGGATTTFSLVSGSEMNCSVTSSGSDFTVTPSAVGPFSFQYDILCDGVKKDTATVNGQAVAPEYAVRDDSAITTVGSTITVDAVANDLIRSTGQTITFAVRNESRCTVTGGTNDGVFTVKIDDTVNLCKASFYYDVLADGVVVGTAKVRITLDSDPPGLDTSTNYAPELPHRAAGVGNVPAGQPLPNGWVATVDYEEGTVPPAEGRLTVVDGDMRTADIDLRPFYGDVAYNIPADSNSLLLRAGGVGDVVLEVPVTGLTVGQEYTFGAFVTNTQQGTPGKSEPTVVLEFAGVSQSITALEYDNVDKWLTNSATATVTAPTETLRITIQTDGDVDGNDLAIAGAYVLKGSILQC